MTGEPAALEVRVDGARCCGAGHCVRIAPEVFDQDPRDGTVVLLEPRPPEALESAVLEAVVACPTSAIVIVART